MRTDEVPWPNRPIAGPRTWTLVKWTGTEWLRIPVTTSDSNYDMGSLYLEANGTWSIIAPTSSGPQPYNPGGEIVQWLSHDEGLTWERGKEMTSNSRYNHSYVRRPVNAHPDFYGFWADGDTRKPSTSSLYFCNREGKVFELPEVMENLDSKPVAVI